MIDDQLTFSKHIAKTTRSCRFALLNFKKIPFFQNMFHNSLFKLSFSPGWTIDIALLAGLPASSIKPLQLIQNAAARLLFNEPKGTCHTSVHQFALATNSCSHKIQGVNVCLQNHHWLCTALSKSITSHLCASRSLHSASEHHFIVPSQRSTKSFSQTFKLNVPSWWNDLPDFINLKKFTYKSISF